LSAIEASVLIKVLKQARARYSVFGVPSQDGVAVPMTVEDYIHTAQQWL
jgi:hypothetical protein